MAVTANGGQGDRPAKPNRTPTAPSPKPKPTSDPEWSPEGDPAPKRPVGIKIRLKRTGKIRAPYYRIIVAESRIKRDGRVIEEIGKYHPTETPSSIEVKSDRAQYWLGIGAQPSPQVEAILKLTGDWGIFKGEKKLKPTIRVTQGKIEVQVDDKKKPIVKPRSAKAAQLRKKKMRGGAEGPAVED